jgi:histone-lysine N-methyltransferase SETMAR
MDSAMICKSVDSNPSTSTRRLSAELGVAQTTVVRHLKAIGKVNKRCREVPHDLTEKQANRRIETCRKLLENPRDDRFIRRIVTSDEKWIYFNNPDKRNQWLDIGQVAQPVPRRERFSKKTLLCVWWNFEGVIHFELLPNGVTVDADLYCAQLDRMFAKLQQKYPSLVNRKGVLLQQDNAKPHTAKKTVSKIEDTEYVELLPHPAYSPDLAPSDYYLFRAMAHFLTGRTFNNVEQVEKGCLDFFGSKTKEWYHRGIEQLADRWLKTIDSNGLYFEN